ncbi:hypothetical protein AAFF_G00120820 [Aldrovandia affinis]|uniref:Uncharacterized protein n=1 Tax=Aldrovandia affinis TaxID=143900 RepID=A0AAD7RS31_9TELE|nr:hypothetical protein AAFF_G00120820 [Aldrovandia affinis]
MSLLFRLLPSAVDFPRASDSHAPVCRALRWLVLLIFLETADCRWLSPRLTKGPLSAGGGPGPREGGGGGRSNCPGPAFILVPGPEAPASLSIPPGPRAV